VGPHPQWLRAAGPRQCAGARAGKLVRQPARLHQAHGHAQPALPVLHRQGNRETRVAERNRPAADDRSAYNPTAYSRSHASGIWQFIPSTGKNYGLQQNFWQDERRDVAAATRAALDYLEKLYDQFGSWDLALAAYNWGEGAVARAIAKNQARGLPADYRNLTMPRETRYYVPKLQAVKNIIANPGKFGIELAAIPNEAYFTSVPVPRNIDVQVGGAARRSARSMNSCRSIPRTTVR